MGTHTQAVCVCVCVCVRVRGVRRAAGDAQRARWAMRGGLVVGARIVCDAMRCARAGCDAMRCAAMHGMRCADRCAASWLHSRGAGGAMLFSFAIEGFLGWLSRFIESKTLGDVA